MNEQKIKLIREVERLARTKKLKHSDFNKYTANEMNIIQAAYYLGREIAGQGFPERKDVCKDIDSCISDLGLGLDGNWPIKDISGSHDAISSFLSHWLEWAMKE